MYIPTYNNKKRTRVPARADAVVLPKQRETAILMVGVRFGILTNRIGKKNGSRDLGTTVTTHTRTKFNITIVYLPHKYINKIKIR